MKIKKKAKRIAALIAALCMLIISAVSSSAADEPKPNPVYVALGDSIAYGYGLPDIENQRYPKLVADNLGLDMYDYAVNGMTSEGLLTLLGGISLGAESENFRTLSTAKLITVSIGSNDLLGVFTSLVMSVTAQVGQALDLLNDIFAQTLRTAVLSDSADAMFEAGVESFRTNLPKIHAALRDMNPDAVIVYTNIYNPYVGCAIGDFDLGITCEHYISEINDILTEKQSELGYIIADVHTPMNTPGMSNVNILAGNVDPHPCIAGHIAFSETVSAAAYDALNTKQTVQETEPSEVITEAPAEEADAEPAETFLPSDVTEAADGTEAADAAQKTDGAPTPDQLVGSKPIPWGKAALYGLVAAVFIVTGIIVSKKNKKK